MLKKLKIVFMFSGQGSQYRGMGKKLADQYPVFSASLNKSDAVVRKNLNRSLLEELFCIKKQRFDDILITHPAIVAVEIALYRVLESLNIMPDHVIGTSLGEFAAAAVAGIWSDETAVEAAIEQAKALVRSESSGGMLAVINHKKELVKDYLRNNDLFLASDNFEGHRTYAGSDHFLDALQTDLSRLDISFLRLPVAYPFHSPLIDSAKNDFIYYLSSLSFQQDTRQLFVSGSQRIQFEKLPHDYFWNVARMYFNFPEIIHYFERKGPCLYVDLGPSGTNATFVKYNLDPVSSSGTFSIMTPFNQEIRQIEALVNNLNRP